MHALAAAEPSCVLYLPAGQGSHSVDAAAVANVPLEHGIHVPSSGAPSWVEKVPGRQLTQLSRELAPSRGWYVPRGHFTQVAFEVWAVRLLYVPGVHGVHWGCPSRPGRSAHVPAGHAMQVAFESAPSLSP